MAWTCIYAGNIRSGGSLLLEALAVWKASIQIWCLPEAPESPERHRIGGTGGKVASWYHKILSWWMPSPPPNKPTTSLGYQHSSTPISLCAGDLLKWASPQSAPASTRPAPGDVSTYRYRSFGNLALTFPTFLSPRHLRKESDIPTMPAGLHENLKLHTKYCLAIRRTSTTIHASTIGFSRDCCLGWRLLEGDCTYSTYAEWSRQIEVLAGTVFSGSLWMILQKKISTPMCFCPCRLSEWFNSRSTELVLAI